VVHGEWHWVTEKGVTGVGPSAWQAFRVRVARLYEQNAPQEEILRRNGLYVRRWKQWVVSGMPFQMVRGWHFATFDSG
jgi:hypothetical protein